MSTYILATTKVWNLEAFDEGRKQLPGRWMIITRPADLSHDVLSRLTPRYVFFFHWSAIVPDDILGAVECVCFHMTDVPFGRGGSPLQNLIAGGHTDTVLAALRMTHELDAGPVYMKRPLSLAGSAHEIFRRAAGLCVEMAADIAVNEPKPVAQVGAVTRFKRRTPEQSRIPEHVSLGALYDHVRMLDAPTYPPAFLDYGDYRLEFTDAALDGDAVRARVVIRPKGPTR